MKNFRVEQRVLISLLFAMLLTGCGDVGQLTWLTSLSASIVWGGIQWALAGGILGFLVAVVAFRVFRKQSAGGSPKSYVWALVGLLSQLTLFVLFPACIAYLGFFEGMLRASSYELSEGDFAQEYFPIIGGAGADLVGAVLLAGDFEVLANSSSEDFEALKAAFRAGEREIEAAQIPAMIAAIDGDYVRETAAEIKYDLMRKVPSLRSGGGRQALDWFMDNFSDALVRVAIERGLEEKGLGNWLDLFGAMVRQLPQAAAREGDPTTLSHRETAAFLVEVAIADGVIKFVVRPFCRVNQLGVVIPMLLALCLPLLLLWKGDAVARVFSRSAEPAGPYEDSSGRAGSAGIPAISDESVLAPEDSADR